jgi:tether containing UBX domain for GLUT4
MNRELASFTDLQKSLAQLGFNTGSALLRLSFRATETPLEEAMVQIQDYFTSIEGEGPAAPPSQPQQSAPATEPQPAALPTQPEWTEESHSQPALQPQPETSTTSSPQSPTATSASGRPISVFRPPTASTPSAALTSHNEADYTPTIEHAQIHQKVLQQNTRNVRLKTEAELAAQAEEEAAKWAAVKNVEVKIRFPDQSTIVTPFTQSDNAADLYHFVRECLETRWRSEVFLLRNPGIRGKNEFIPDDSGKKLIKDLQLKGRVLLTFAWDEQKASVQARSTKSVLREDLRERAQELEVKDVTMIDVEADKDPGVKINVGKMDTGKSEDSGQSKSKMPKWLKGLNKK